MRGSSGTSRLRSVLQRDVVPPALPPKAVQDWCDYGRILADNSLKLDRYADPFPPRAYKISFMLKLLLLKAQHPVVNVTVSSTDVGDHGSHSHTVTADVPDMDNPFGPLAPGDRVFCLWLEDEREPVVIDRLESPL